MNTTAGPDAIERTCARCGTVFHTARRQYYCHLCRKSSRRPAPRKALSNREIQVVNLVRLAKRNREIAVELHLAEGTVKEYLHSIFQKLNVGSRLQLALHEVQER